MVLVDRAARLIDGASRHNEGKLHLGYVYAAEGRTQTHKLLSRGSLQFFDLLEQVAPGADRVVRSAPFFYVVAADSQRSPDELWTHMRDVDCTVKANCEALGITVPPQSAPADETQTAAFGPRAAAAFATPEIAVNPASVADHVASAVLADGRIVCLVEHEVVGVDRCGSRYRIATTTNSGRTTIEVDAVVNALWESRHLIDRDVGLDHEPLSTRWKATVVLTSDRSTPRLPPTTVILGPYGDVVPYGDGSIYVSWYPTCRLAMTTNVGSRQLSSIRSLAQAVDEAALKGETISGLRPYVPAVAALHGLETFRVGGGFIVAVGDTDIDDPDSGLHDRHQIGFEIAERWVSISTGKFCTAPMFAVEAADALHGRLS